jgi:hypothetical protein
MKNAIFKAALSLTCLSTVLPFALPTYAKDAGGNTTLTEPLRIRAPRYAKQRSTKQNPNCPCPYDRNFRGNICGGGSAYAKEGGDEPLCYAGETTSRQMWWYSPQTQTVDESRQGQ